jgi:hypothetical protein
LSTEIEGKKKNLLGSGKLQHVGFSSKTQDEITKKNLCKAEHNVIKEMSISNFPRFLKDSKKNKSKKVEVSTIPLNCKGSFKSSIKEINFMGGVTSQHLSALDARNKKKKFTNQSVIKTGNNLTEFNKGGFFPYRKSFLCYWLLPFVGFVSSATLSLGKQHIKNDNLYISNSLQKSELNIRPKGKLDNNLLINFDTLDYSLNKKGTNDFVTDNFIKGQVSSKSLNNVNKNDSSSTMQTNKNNMYIGSKTNLNRIGSTNVENSAGSLVPTRGFGREKMPHSEIFSLLNPLGTSETRMEEACNKRIKLPTEILLGQELSPLNTSISNSLKYCMLYLDCLENDLNFLSEKTSKNTFNILPCLEQFNNLKKSTFEPRTSAFYPNSFFNRVLLHNESFKRFLSEPLKINLNFPLENSNNNINNESSYFTLEENLKDKIQEKLFMVSQKNINYGNRKSSSKFGNNLSKNNLSKNNLSKNNLSKNNPVTSFLRALTLLDKYMVYKPIVQNNLPILIHSVNKIPITRSAIQYNLTNVDEVKKLDLSASNLNIENKKLTKNISIQPELIDKLFSYFSKESTYLPLIEENSKEFSSRKLEDFKYPFSPEMIFKTSTFSGPYEKNLLHKFSNESKCNFTLGVGNNKQTKEKLLLEFKANELNQKIYDKISKDKLYNVVLSYLKETLNKSSVLSDSYSNKTPKKIYNANSFESLNTDGNKLNKMDRLHNIKLKHPILMSNKSLYPLLSSKNKSISFLLTCEAHKGFTRKTEFENFKNNFPSMLQNVSPIFKEKRPLEKNVKVSRIYKENLPTFTDKVSKGSIKEVQSKLYSDRDSRSIQSIETSNKNKNNLVKNKYFNIKNYINKYTRYALKDFLILNKISTYIQSIPQEFSIKTDVKSKFKESYPSGLIDKDPSSFGYSYENPNSPILDSEIQAYKNRVEGVDCPPETTSAKDNLLKIGCPNENLILIKESPSDICKIRKNDKTAKLLRAYFSIKKPTKKNIYGTKKNPTSLNCIKQKILLDLISKSYVKNINKPSFIKDFKNPERIFKNWSFSKQIRNISINKKRYISRINGTKSGNDTANSLKIKKGLNFLSTQLRETNNINNIKKFSISPRLLLNNRLLLEIKTDKNIPSKTSKSKFIPNIEILRKRKTIQKKRRITKIKKETRRRKKRMRFFPRPSWLRYRFYSQFLKNRRHTKQNIKPKFSMVGLVIRGDNTGESARKEINVGSYLNKTNIENFNNRSYKKNLYYIREKNADISNKNVDFVRYEKMLKKPKNVFGVRPYKSFPYTTGNSTVKISPSIMGEFKTAFWKSYWLRSNIKPYFNKIKMSLKDIKETQKYSTNIEPLGNLHEESFTKKNLLPLGASDTSVRDDLTNFNNPLGARTYTVKKSNFLGNVRNLIISFLGLNNNQNTTITKNSKDLPIVLHSLSKKDIESYYKTANYLAEYNEISSKRIQQFVSQIRENLTLNGHVKVRPSRISMNFRQARESKGSKKHSINFLKRPTLRYNSMSRLRLYWAFSKGTTNLAGLGISSFLPGAETMNGNNFNKRKQIWTTEKFRQQTKENKTKKFLKQIKTKLQVLLNETPYISLEKNIPLWNTLIIKSIKKLRIQEEKLQNLAFVNIKTNSHLFPINRFYQENLSGLSSASFRTNRLLKYGARKSYTQKSKQISWRQLNIRKNRFKNSLKRTAKVQPFISGKTNYWWDYSNNTPFTGMNSFFSTPINYDNSLMQVYGPQNNMLNSQIKKGWSSFKSTSFQINQIGMESNLSAPLSISPNALQINTILFHFCSLVTLLSISQIRGLLKFSFIGVNKIYSLFERLIPSYLYNIPFKSSQNINEKSNNQYIFNKGIDSGFNLLQTTEGQNLKNQKNGKLFNLKVLSSNKKEKNSDLIFYKNNLFDFEKRNNSFLYTFYLKNNKYIKSNLFISNQKIVDGISKSVNLNPRLKNQNKSSKDYQNFYIKPTVNISNKVERPLRESSYLKTRVVDARINSLLSFLSIAGIYSLLNYLVKKPIFFYYKLLNTYPIGQGKISLRESSYQMKNFSIMYSLLLIRFGFNNFMQLSKNASNMLGQRAKLESAFRSIYTFFEKPGVLIVDWVAYLFLVEWASDITNTLPDNIDTQIAGSPFNKLTRTIYTINPLLASTQAVMNGVTLKGVGDNDLATFLPGLTSKTTFLSLASTFLKRRIYHLYEILVLQFYQPDTDLLVRQKKGIVFWDIWGDFLTQTAEDSNVNISELTSLKEEQIKLLENASDNINFKTKNIISSPKQKIYSKVPFGRSFISPLNISPYLETRVSDARTMKKSNSNLGAHTYKKQTHKNKPGIFSSIMSKDIYSKPSTGSLGMPSTGSLGMPSISGVEYQNIDSGLHQWGSQQFLSYAIKSKDTELFIDLHPPRALASVLKNKESSQQLRAISPMGSLVCQIFAGILYKQISKNILIVGNTNRRNKKNESSFLNDASSSLEKTLLVQAIAGETELKIITDNAYRYALVYRGVAVGIKLLRDVFDSLSLQTPCFFLIEDIHAIGERRPFLISDDTPEGNIEIHEKNQVLYQLSKHVISHYKKPYKGDFSLSIPTNHFCFDFFKERNQNNSRIGKASISRQNTISPKIYNNQTPNVEQPKQGPRILSSRLLRPSTELLSPPATSPFSVLTLKEEKKFKTHKKVSDLPLTGKISSQGENTSSQDSQKTGPTYSIRAKVALLADIAISSLSVKLDMITDLLVIIDSVKGNRGFVVFATTHIPFVLDPALRRPGRLDETISFGFSSKNNSFEVSHFGILNVPRTTYSQISPISTFNTYASLGKRGGGSLDFSLTSTGIDTNTILSRLCQKAVHPFTTSSHSYLKRTSSLFHFFPESLFNNSSPLNFTKENSDVVNKQQLEALNKQSIELAPARSATKTDETCEYASNFLVQKDNIFSHISDINYPKTTKILSQVATKASAYLNASIKCLHEESISKDENNLDLRMNNALIQLPDLSFESTLSNSSHLSMYASPHFFKNNISLLISGKIGEFFLFSKQSQLKTNSGGVAPQHLSMLNPRSNNLSEFNSMSSSFISKCDSVSTTRRSSLMPVITESISSLVLSFVQKRFLYKSNLMLPTLFNLINYSSLIEPSSPPITSILLPAKRYENLKRSLSYYQNQDQNFGSGIMEKINIHQQQRLVKRLYNIPVKETFKSEIIQNRLSSFSNASLIIGNMSPSVLQKISNSNWFVRNRIFSRHSHYLTNQWWNGQLPEHNAETTFLSDIDWRYTFIEREARDILLDFPDADQHYNPRNRRWVGNSNWAIEKMSTPSLALSQNSFYSEIYSHFIYDSFLKAFNVYEQNREVFDYYSFHICKQGLNAHLHEFERLKLIQRFLQT